MRLAWLVAGAMVVTSVLAGSGCSSSEPTPERSAEKTGTASQAIQGGSVDTSNQFKFAVGVCHGNPNQCFGVCSGALILPNVVATARHCVDRSPQIIDCSKNPSFEGRKNGSFNVTTNVQMFGGSGSAGWYSVKSIAVPDDDHICGNDIALLVLNQSIPANVTKPIIPGVQYLMWDPEQYAPYFIGIGYGNTSPSNNDSGTRRVSKPISVLCVPGWDERPCPAGFNAKEFVAGDGTCSGDSGSSAFEQGSVDNGAPVSFGVLSRGGQSEDGTTCQGSAYTRFDAHRDFVLEVAKAASNDWTLYPEPSWTAYKPPPGPKKDAGADGGKTTTTPSGRGLGEECETNEECSSGICSDAGDGTLVCSRACDESEDATCPEGYECRESLCLPPVDPPAAPAASTTTTTTTCAAVPGSSAGSWALVALGAAAVVGAVRRRKR